MTEQEITEKFISDFPIGFFAREDGQYDYRDSPISQAQFKSWQENQTNIAKMKQDTITRYFLSLRTQELQELVGEIEGMKYKEYEYELIFPNEFGIIGEDGKHIKNVEKGQRIPVKHTLDEHEREYNSALDQVLQTIKSRIK